MEHPAGEEPGLPAPRRNYIALFGAMSRALESLVRGADDSEALKDGFRQVVAGFGARKAVLLAVDGPDRSLRELEVAGLRPEQVDACVGGESAPGVSASLIREVIEAGGAVVREDPRRGSDSSHTASMAEGNYSAIAAPVLDPYTDRPLAVIYLQTPEFPSA